MTKAIDLDRIHEWTELYQPNSPDALWFRMEGIAVGEEFDLYDISSPELMSGGLMTSSRKRAHELAGRLRDGRVQHTRCRRTAGGWEAVV